MRLRLGSVNLALLSIYFVPVWGHDAVRALVSPYSGFEDRTHAAAAAYVRELFDLGMNGLVHASHFLAGVKLVIAAGFVAYGIEFARSWATGRDVDRQTIDVVLILAVAGIVVWAIPGLAFGSSDLIRLSATQLLLVTGAVFVIVLERQIEKQAQASRPIPDADAGSFAMVTSGVRAAGRHPDASVPRDAEA